jgi:hypothetical protein
LLLAITSLVGIHWLNPERGVVLAGLFFVLKGVKHELQNIHNIELED